MIECKTLTVVKPAKISAIDVTLDKEMCDEPCNAVATITWKNTGSKTGSFEPAIIVNGTRTGSGTTVTLTKDQTHTQAFSLTSLTEGVYTICPDPN